jgi:acyl carrier protein
MNPELILKTIVDFMVELEGIDPSIIKPESKLAADLGLDSLDHVELIMLIEDELNIHIPDEEDFDLEGCTVQMLVDYIVREGKPA